MCNYFENARGIPSPSVFIALSARLSVYRWRPCCSARHARRGEPLRRDPGGGRDLRRVQRAQDGHRGEGAGVRDDPLRQSRTWSPGGDR